MEKSQIPEPLSQPTTDSTTINLMHAVQILCSAGRAMFVQAELHGQLARVQWAEEKSRLLKMLVLILLGYACLLSSMLFTGILVLSFFWETTHRVSAVLAMVTVYGIGTGIAWLRFHALSALSGQAFAATYEELAADIALIRSKL